MREIESARHQDFWTASGQLDPAFSGISVALVDRKGTCVGAIGMTVLSALMMDERLRSSAPRTPVMTQRPRRPCLAVHQWRR